MKEVERLRKERIGVNNQTKNTKNVSTIKNVRTYLTYSISSFAGLVSSNLI